MKRTWNVTDEGVNFNIEYHSGFFSPFITVNGEKKKLRSKNMLLMILDEVIPLRTKEARLVVVGANVRLAVDDIYLGTNEKYMPIEKLPSYLMIMSAIMIVGGGIFNGAMGGVIAFLFISLMIAAVSKSIVPKFGEAPNHLRPFLICLFFMIASLVVTFCFGMFFAFLFSSL